MFHVGVYNLPGLFLFKAIKRSLFTNGPTSSKLTLFFYTNDATYFGLLMQNTYYYLLRLILDVTYIG